MLNNEIKKKKKKCIEECDKQINFSKNLIVYLEQYVRQMEAMKTMANSAKSLQDVNPLNLMNKFMDFMSNTASIMNPADKKKPEPVKKEESTCE